MAEKLCSGKPPLTLDEAVALNEVTKVQLAFNKATFELGLQLIEEYKSGRNRDSNKTLDAIIKILEVQPKAKWRD